MNLNKNNLPLNDILSLSLDKTIIDPKQTYQFAGVYSFGRGLFKSSSLEGTNTSYKYFNKLHKDHIVISKVKGWEGAIALVHKDFEGLYVSPQYPTFKTSSKENDIEFIYYFLSQKKIWKVLLDKSRGIGARRNSINEEKFLSLEMPIFQLTKQKKIVKTINSIKEKVAIIKILSEEQLKGIEKFYYCLFEDLRRNNDYYVLSNFLHPKSVQVTIDPTILYKQVTSKWWNKGAVLRKESLGSEISSKQYLVNKGDFIISKIDARHAAYGIIPENLDGAVVTGDFPVFEIQEMNPNYIDFVSKSNYFLEECKRNSQGTTRRVRLDINKFLSIKIPVPSPKEQNKIVDLVNKVDLIKQKTLEIEKEFEDLLPSVIDKAFKGKL